MAVKLERCMKILTLVPWIQSVGSTTFGELSKRFDYKPKELLRDLVTLTMVGIPPYSPGDLTFIAFDPDEDAQSAFENKKSPKADWTVSITDEEFFLFPPKLTQKEILILLTAYSFIQSMNLEIDPITQKTLEKIKNALSGGSGSDDFGFEVGFSIEREKFLKEIQEAIDAKVQIEVKYHSLREAKTADYTLEPYQTFFIDNAGYLYAYSHKTNELRNFRVHRIKEFKMTKTAFTQEVPVLGKGQELTSYISDDKDPKIVLELDLEGRWALDLLKAVEIVELPDGKTHATIYVGTQGFIERLLLQVGKHGRIISGDYKNSVGSNAAKKLLEKYTKTK